MGLFGNKSNTLEIPGIGAGVNQEQMNMFANAAQQSGLQDYGMQMLNQYTGGGLDTEQIELIHHMVARHPNEMDIFLMQSPHFLLGLSELISLIIRKELYTWEQGKKKMVMSRRITNMSKQPRILAQTVIWMELSS